MTFPTNGKWTASTAEEAWNGHIEFDTRDEAIAYAISEFGVEPGGRVYVGQVHEIANAEIARHAVCAERVIEDIDQWLYDQVGDEVAYELPVTPAQREDLDTRLAATVRQWLDEHGLKAPCWRVDHVSSHVVPGREQP